MSEVTFADFHQDGLSNEITKLGVTGKDKRMVSEFNVVNLSKKKISEMYMGDDMNKKVVDMLPEHMVRKWFELQVPEGRDKKIANQIMADFKRLKVKAKFQLALEKMRLYGGSGILLGVSDGVKDLSKPLNPEKVSSVDSLNVFDCFELKPVERQSNPFLPDFGEIEFFEIKPQSVRINGDLLKKVHRSRLIIFNSSARTDDVDYSAAGKGWGASVYVQLLDILRDYKNSVDSVSHVMSEFTQSIFKMKGLADAIRLKQSDLIKNRVDNIAYSRSVVGGILMDAENEDYIRQTTVLSGIPEIMDRFQTRVAAGAETPVIVLFGNSPSGLNATGTSDLTNFYNTVSSKQEKYMLPQLQQLIEIVGLAKKGLSKGKVPLEFEIEFLPLEQQSSMEAADLRHTMAQTDDIYMKAGVLSPRDVASSRGFGDARYSLQTNMSPDKVSDQVTGAPTNGDANKAGQDSTSKVQKAI